MDIGGEGDLPDALDKNDGETAANLNISDVLHAISLADPSFDAGGALIEESMARAPPPPHVRIVEQPASKALRFRYECEGRSAGSIPGVNSTADRKTYPTIEIVGHTGKAIVVVSCVTRDEPYKPHPHNLVGRDRCSKGVCTQKIDVTPDNNLVTFSNLGIQCVKRRDISEALRVREELRVDPFRTGYAHRNQPQSIDLNAVRLCFQVFVPDDAGRVRLTLPPVVSEVIYDKKAMSDLQILRLSSSAGPARGGTELILLCEKVTREDIAVVLYEERRTEGAGGGGSSAVVWEEAANIVMVHKQYAIAFTTPPYREPHAQEHREVFIQLKRPTDNARSVGVPFTYIPEYQGTAKKQLPDLSVLSLLLAERRDNNNNDKKHDKTETLVSSTSDSVTASDEGGSALVADMNGNIEVIDEAEPSDIVASNEKSLNDLLDQVAELDEIYSENRTRLEICTSMNEENDADEDFNDAGTYTSLQLAFKNPLPIAEPEPEPYEDVQVQTFRGPIIEFTTLKRDTEEERAPPLPPKRVRKTQEQFKSSQTSVDSILKPGKQIPISRNVGVLTRDHKELSVARSEPALPPVKKRSFFSRLFRRKEKSPAPSVKSEGKKDSKSKPVGRSVSSVSGQRPSKFKSSVSHTSLKDNASTTGLSYTDSVTRISLHGDDNDKSASQSSLRRPASLAASLGPIPPTDGDTILVAESVLALDANAFKKLQDDLDLTEAEHYALYMAVAPHATVSEFDETSCYYSPIDGNTDYLKRKRQKTLHSSLIQKIEQERAAWQEQKPIKSEPSDKSPLHMATSPRLYTPLDQQWMPQQIGGMGEGGTLAPPYYDVQWIAPAYQQLSPQMQVPAMSAPRSPLQGSLPGGGVSPGLQGVSPDMTGLSPQHRQGLSPQVQQVMSPQHQQVMSPHQQVMSPQHHQVMSPQHHQVMSPHQQVMSPQHHQVMSPHQQVMSPQHQVMSPHLAVSPGLQAMSPQGHMGMDERQMGHVSPNLMQQQQMNQTQMPQQMPQQQMTQQIPQQQMTQQMPQQQMTQQIPQQQMTQQMPQQQMTQQIPQQQMTQQMSQQQMPQQTMDINSSPSLSRLLEQGDQSMPQLNSGDLSNLSALLNQYRPSELSDSLNRLSTSDLFPERAEL